MLIRAGCRSAHRLISTSSIIYSAPDVTSQSGYATNNPKLKRGPGERDITNLDILEERIKAKGKVRTITVGGQKQEWAYRSEIVGRLGLDNNHKNIWIAYGFIIIFGFGAFVYVKSNVILNRKEEMEQREKIRKSLNLIGVDRKKIAIVDE